MNIEICHFHQFFETEIFDSVYTIEKEDYYIQTNFNKEKEFTTSDRNCMSFCIP